MRAAADREVEGREWTRMANYELARLMAFSFNEPKKMPEYKPAQRRLPKQKPASDEADQAYVRAYLIGLAMRSKS